MSRPHTSHIDLRRCKTNSVDQRAQLSIPRLSIRFWQDLKRPRTQIYMDLTRSYIETQARIREEMLFIDQMEDQVWSPAQLSPLKDTLRECLFSWYVFLCFNGLENFDIFCIRRNNIHGNDLLDSSVENLHLVCYTESLVVVLFLLPHKRGRDLK